MIIRNPSDVPDRVAVRLFTKWELDGGCLVSTYSAGSHGYAQIGWNEAGERVVTVAHRVAWIVANGPIPEGMTVDHECKTRKCINPKHLRLLPNYENARRTFGRDWPLGQCVNGHPNSELYTEPNGRIRCNPCKTAAQARYRERKRRERQP